MIKVTYNLLEYSLDYDCEYKELNKLSHAFDEKILFPKMIDTICKKHGVSKRNIYVEHLKSNTWGKLVDEKLLDLMNGDDYHYKWLNYSLKDVNNTFHLFDNPITIIVDGGGIGREVGEVEGIKISINPGEKDRHEFEPHVHCKYGKEKLRLRIDTLELMKSGKDKEFKNPKKMIILRKWVKKYQKELLEFYNTFALSGDCTAKFYI